MGANGERKYECRLCGTGFSSSQRLKALRKCPACKESQNWRNVAPEPKWFPKFLPTRENGRSKDQRWTHFMILASLAVPFLAVILVSLGSLAFQGPTQYEIPSVVGMNLQSAQDCLQEHGFRNLDDKSTESTFGQIIDSNWVVTRQTRIGPTTDRSSEITLWVVRGSDGNYGTTFCPKPKEL
jgi:hypothetical protein